MPVDLEEFVAGFLVEADEHLHSVHRNLVAVSEALKEGRPEPRAVRELFRSLHTIKGLSAMVGAEPVVALSHEMEGILRSADNAGGRLSEHALDLLLRGTRAIEERVHAISKNGISAAPPAPPALLESLALAENEGAQGSSTELELSVPESIASKLGAADREQLIQATNAGHRAVLVEFEPSPERAEQGLNITAIRTRLANVGDLVKVVPQSSSTAPTGISFCLVLVTGADDAVLQDAAGGAIDAILDIHVTRRGAQAQSSALPCSPEPEADWIVGSDHSIRVDVRRLDEALEQLSSLVVTRFKMARVVSELGERGVDIRELEGIVSDNTRQLRRLRAAITKARMVPLAELLQRLPLVVRGLTKDTEKSVGISIQAGSAEVDKAVADRIFPAVVHMVRNAVDHAIESRDERKRLDKPESGSLSIVCDDSSGTNLELTVRDDGRGIDRDAVARKLARPSARTDEELLQQIAAPGLSTRAATTRTSGRGMGMDIVKRTVQMLGGALALRTERGKGTTFTIRVPVSVTIVDVFSFVAGEQVFVAPVAMVEEIVDIDPVRLVRAPVIDHSGPASRLTLRRGGAIPFVTLDAVLRHREHSSVSPKALIVSPGERAIAFGIERMLGQQEAVVRPLDDALVRVPGITGATDLGDGRPTLVLDLTTLGAAVMHDAGTSP